MDLVSETMRQPWDTTAAMTALEFFSMVCYNIDKQEHERIRLERWKRSH